MKYLLVVAALLAACVPLRAQDVDWPDSRVSEIAQAFFAAFNSQDLDSLTDFERSYGDPSRYEEGETPESRAERLVGFAVQLGHLDVMRIEEHNDRSIVVLAQPENAPVWLNCTFETAKTGGRLSSIQIDATSPPRPGVDPNWHKQDYTTVGALLQAARKATDAPAIAVAVMRNGRLTSQGVVGMREAEGASRATLADRWHIGSITKSMTSTAAAYLIEQNTLDWDDTLAELLPDIDMRPEYGSVTVEQLMQHRAGLPAMTSLTEEEAARFDAVPGPPPNVRTAFARELLQEDPIGPSGEASNYSNAGYGLLGLVIDRASGSSWEELIHDVVFTQTDFDAGGIGWPASLDPDQPMGHTHDGERFIPVPTEDYELDTWIDPAGDVHCSIVDLVRYGNAHLVGLGGQDSILKSETIKRLHTPQNEQGGLYAAGWVIRPAHEDTGPIHWHNGSGGTFFAQLELEPENGRVIAVVTNVGFAGQELANKIIEAVRTNGW